MLSKTKLLLSFLAFLACINNGICQFQSKAENVFFYETHIKSLVKIQKFQDGFILFWNHYETRGEDKIERFSNAKFTHIQIDFLDRQANLVKSLKYESQRQMKIIPISYADILIDNDKIYLMISFIENEADKTYLYCIKDYKTICKESIYPYKFGQFLISQNNHIVGTCYKELSEHFENEELNKDIENEELGEPSGVRGVAYRSSDFNAYYLIEIVNNKWSVDKKRPLKSLPFKDGFLKAPDQVDIENDRLTFYLSSGLDFCSIGKFSIYDYKLNTSTKSDIKTIDFGEENQSVRIVKSKKAHEFFMLRGTNRKESDSIEIYITKIVTDKNEIMFQDEKLFSTINKDEACFLFNFGLIDMIDDNVFIYKGENFAFYSLENTAINEKVFSPIVEYLNRELKKENLKSLVDPDK